MRIFDSLHDDGRQRQELPLPPPLSVIQNQLVVRRQLQQPPASHMFASNNNIIRQPSAASAINLHHQSAHNINISNISNNNNNNNNNINQQHQQQHQHRHRISKQQATTARIMRNKSSKIGQQLEICQSEFWRSLLAECLSSCIYVFIVCSTRISWTGSIIGHEPNLVAMALASGITMKLLIYSFRSVHINPALTIALFLLMRISLLRTIFYIFAQCLGAIAASAFLYLVSVKGHGGALGIDNPHEQLLLWHVLVVELVISFLVTFVTFATFSWSTYKTFISSSSSSNGNTTSISTITNTNDNDNIATAINTNKSAHIIDITDSSSSSSSSRHIRNNSQAPFLISNHYNRVCDDATSNIISDIRTNKSQMANFNTNLTVSNKNNVNNNNHHHLSHNTMLQPGQQQNSNANNNQLIFTNQEQVENFIATIQQQQQINSNNINNQLDSGYSNNSGSSNGNNSSNNNRTSANNNNNNNRIDYASELSYNPTNNTSNKHYSDEHYFETIQQQNHHPTHHRAIHQNSDDHDDDGYDNHRLYAVNQLQSSLNQPSSAPVFSQALAPNGFPVHFTGNQALVIGLSYIAATLTGIPVSGASLNPARSLGPAFIMNRWTNHWVFWLGPIAGAIFAAFIYEFVFNPLREISLCYRPSILKQQTNRHDKDDDNLKKKVIEYQRSPLVKSSSSFRSIQSNTAALLKSTLNLPPQFSQHHMNFQNQGKWHT